MRLRIVNETKGTLLADQARLADSFPARLRGLLGRRALSWGEGLHLVPCNSIHTFFMHFPIDVLFLSKNLTVVKSLGTLPPWRISGVYRNAHSVLELPVGTVNGSNTQEGDRLNVTALSEKPGGPDAP
jgi:hypothetical protein